MPAPIFIPFGPLELDSSADAAINSGVSIEADLVYPGKRGFIPAKGVDSTASAISLNDCAGACLIKTGTTSYRVYAHKIATGTHSIRSFDSASFGAAYTGTEVGTGFSAPDTGEYWRFAKFGNFLIAVQDNVDPQVLNWSSAGSFGTLSGSPPRASGVFTIEEFVFLTGLASNRRKLQWSALGDHTGWTVGTGLSDEQEFPDGEDICGIAGGKSGFVIQRQAIRSYQFLPGDTSTIFSFDKIAGVPGCSGLYAWAFAGQTLYYLSEEGVCAIGPGGFRRIGNSRVDSAFRALTEAQKLSVIAIADPVRSCIRFSIPAVVLSGYIYDYVFDQWVGEPRTTQFLVDHLESTGGAAQMLVLFSDQKLYSLNGNNEASALTTAPFSPFSQGPNFGKRATITAIRPITDGTINSVRVTPKDKPSGSYGDAITSTTQESNGKFSILASGLYFKIRVVLSSNNGGSYIRGFEVWVDPAGEA